MPRLPDPAEHLVQVALDLVSNEGMERLTLRRVARRAGGSHSAPLRHFPSLSILASEVAARGFARLGEASAKAAAALPVGAGARARLRAVCRGYIETAVESPGLFTLMFRPDLTDFSHEPLAQHGYASFDKLVGAVRAAQDTGFQPEHDTRALAGAIWSAIHGLAMLWSQNAYQAPTGSSLETAIDTLLELIVPVPEETSHE